GRGVRCRRLGREGEYGLVGHWPGRQGTNRPVRLGRPSHKRTPQPIPPMLAGGDAPSAKRHMIRAMDRLGEHGWEIAEHQPGQESRSGPAIWTVKPKLK